MKKLNDFADDINKCSKCGLCQSVCPIYKITGNDCAVSRGKFVMLNGVLNGDLKLNKNINKYLDMCLKCGKCEDFCPSNIKVCDIINTAKYEYAKNSTLGKFEKAIESKELFGTTLKLAQKVSHLNYSHPKQLNKKTNATKLIYFKGCVNNVIPKTENALKKVYSNLNVELIEKDFDCCGLPFLSSGNMERFEEVKQHNLNLLNCDFDYVLTDCASCESTLKNYFDEEDSTPKFVNAGEFVSTQDVTFEFTKPLKVTFHKPCHLKNADFIKSLLSKCKNVEYIEMEGFDECCGFAGEFAIKNPKISQELSKKKANNIIKTQADIVLTTCPACVLGIQQGYIASGNFHKNPPKIMNIMEFLAKADNILL